MKKFIWMILAIVIVFGLAACMLGGGTGGGGTVYVDGVPIGGTGVAQATGDGAAAPAQATQPAEPQPQGGMEGMIGLLWPLLLMFAVVYFLIMRPQRKQAKATREMQEGLRVGENVITTSGFFGKIVGVGTDSFLVEFGEGGRSIKIWIRRTDIAGVRSPVMTPPAKVEEPPKEIEDKKEKKEKMRRSSRD